MDSEASQPISREITIISITKNDPDGIRRTVESVTIQDFEMWRLVIVLSSEADASFEYVKNLSGQNKKIHYLVPDSLGIYKAMNFALDRFNPELTWFLNGGDEFKSTKILSRSYIFMEMYKPSILFGGYEVFENGKKRQFKRSTSLVYPRKFSLNIRSGNHQAMLFDLAQQKEARFNLDFKLASDFLFVLEVLGERPGLRVPEIFVEIEPGGVSHDLINKVWFEKQQARERFFGKYSVDWLLGYFWTLSVKSKKTIKSILRLLRNHSRSQLNA